MSHIPHLREIEPAMLLAYLDRVGWRNTESNESFSEWELGDRTVRVPLVESIGDYESRMLSVFLELERCESRRWFYVLEDVYARSAGTLGSQGLTEREEAFVEHLRKESQILKECVTKYSFAGIAVAAGLVAAIVRMQIGQPEYGVASVVVLAFMFAVANIAVYKYGSSNRCAGYELHLQRTRSLRDNPQSAWKRYMRSVGWEEAMRAWRIIQATVFVNTYKPWELDAGPRPFACDRHTRPEHVSAEQVWFEIPNLMEPGTSYYPGGYLKTVLKIVFVIMTVATLPLLWSVAARVHAIVVYPSWTNGLVLLIMVGLATTVIGATWLGRKQIDARRELLESGMLSIHSCAIMWQVVVIAHFRAMDAIRTRAGLDNYAGYTRELSKQARDINDCKYYIHEWIDDPERASERQRQRRVARLLATSSADRIRRVERLLEEVRPFIEAHTRRTQPSEADSGHG